MCNKATYSFLQEMCCTFLPHFWIHRSSWLKLCISGSETWNGLLGPRECDSSLLQLFCRRGEGHCCTVAVLVRWANLILCLFCTKLWQFQHRTLTVKVSNQCPPAVYYMLQWGVPDEMTKCFKSAHFRMLFTVECAFLKINTVAFRAQSNYNPSANCFV